MKRAGRVVARISVGHRKLKLERGGDVVGNGTSAGDEGWDEWTWSNSQGWRAKSGERMGDERESAGEA